MGLDEIRHARDRFWAMVYAVREAKETVDEERTAASGAKDLYSRSRERQPPWKASGAEERHSEERHSSSPEKESQEKAVSEKASGAEERHSPSPEKESQEKAVSEKDEDSQLGMEDVDSRESPARKKARKR